MKTEKSIDFSDFEHGEDPASIDDAMALDLEFTGEDWEYDSCAVDSMTLVMCAGISRAFVPCDF